MEQYYLKKIISIFFSPLVFLLGVLFFVIIYSYKKREKKILYILIIVFSLLFLFSYGPFVNEISKLFENNFGVRKSYPSNSNYVVLLGGNFNNRVYKLINIYKNLDNRHKIILFGQDAKYNFFNTKRQDNILLSFGIRKDAVIIKGKVLNTRAEIKELKKILGDKSFILISDAIHMTRIMMLCKEYQVNALPYPINFFTKHKYDILSLPSAKHLHQSEKILHEFFGIIYIQFSKLIKSF